MGGMDIYSDFEIIDAGSTLFVSVFGTCHDGVDGQHCRIDVQRQTGRAQIW